MLTRPLAIDLFCGLGGWTDGLLAEGYDVIGFDIECHQYGDHRYPAQLVIQDVGTLHGSQFADAALIVASPPCQGYSYRAMPVTVTSSKVPGQRPIVSIRIGEGQRAEFLPTPWLEIAGPQDGQRHDREDSAAAEPLYRRDFPSSNRTGSRMTNHTIGDAPIEPERWRMMNTLAHVLDDAFNGDKRGEDRTTGFVLMVFAFNDTTGRCNYISNGERADIVKLLEDQLAKFKGEYDDSVSAADVKGILAPSSAKEG